MAYTWLADSDNSHGLLVPAVVLFLIYQKREFFYGIPDKGNRFGLCIICSGFIVYFMGLLSGIVLLQRLSMIITLIGAFMYIFDWSYTRHVIMPLLFLVFMIPMPVALINFVSFPLQLLSSDISAVIIRAVSIPVFQEGNILYFNNAVLEVSKACSGIRSLFSFLFLGSLCAYLAPFSLLRKFTFILLAVPLAFFVNILRVVFTGVIAHLYGSKIATGFLHDISGMIVFAVGAVIYFSIYRGINNRA